MFFSSLTRSVTFPSRAHPASSMIEVIKKVEIIWKLISFDYAKELSQNVDGGTGLRSMRLCMVIMWLLHWTVMSSRAETAVVWTLSMVQATVWQHFLRINSHFPVYLCCVWSAHPEPYNRLWQPGCIPPSGNESFLALVSGCRCGSDLRWAELTGLACLWCPAAAAGRVKEPRLEYPALCVQSKTKTNTHTINIITWRGAEEQRRI